MTYALPHGSGTAPYRPLLRFQNSLPPWARQWFTDGQLRLSNTWANAPRLRSRSDARTFARRALRRILSVPNAVIVLWILTLWWGERTVFRDSVERCLWESWEQWPQEATPHHVAFIADPQLVDPHTYPGRPWPLSALTVKYTDQYLRRSFSLIQKTLEPDSVLFLGDLFDGGREWATGDYSSPEKRYKGYKDDFWKKEFQRFVRIFSDHFNDGVTATRSTSLHGRVMIASLPGNHDLGFGNGVQEAVRERFQTYFGKANRVDVLGNHTFVSVDTVSLSAMDQADRDSDVKGAEHAETGPPNERIWKETEDFLSNMAVHRGRAETEELRIMRNETEDRLFNYKVYDQVVEPSTYKTPQSEVVGFPAVLLTHVPLYRKKGTPCGPLREKYPPSSPDGDLEEDERNAITVAGGYQYQNVLTPTISNDLVTKMEPNLIQVYSGDDHDYCEIVHREFAGSPREITVKSLSWAMGVRRPGFVLTSLWNPIDPQTGRPLSSDATALTLQNHLCLLPDQIHTFIQYGCLFGLTLLVLLIRSLAATSRRTFETTVSGSVLPMTERRTTPPPFRTPPSSSTSSTMSSPRGLASRATSAAPRPKHYHALYSGMGDRDSEHLSNPGAKWKGRRSSEPPRRRRIDRIRHEFSQSVKHVALVVFAWYFYLIWRW